MNTLAELPLKNISDNYVVEHQEELSGAYAKILAFLKIFLGNDSVAAEYLLLSLVSRIYRREGGLTIGALNINLNGVSPEQAALICEFVQAVTPLVCRFDATIQSLSEQRFMPAKNHDTNKMEEGYMGTLINNTVFMFDETRLEPGKLINHGVPNIAAMATLVEMQTFVRDFGFGCQSEMPIDVPVIVLSSARSIVKNTIHVPVEIEGEGPTDVEIAAARTKLD